ncbi:hypothetical protein ACFLZN_02585 [Nanoarchaeota archaeon]
MKKTIILLIFFIFVAGVFAQCPEGFYFQSGTCHSNCGGDFKWDAASQRCLMDKQAKHKAEKTPTCKSGERLVDGDCLSKCDFYDDDAMTVWMIWSDEANKCVPEGDKFGVYTMPKNSFKVVKDGGTKVGIVKYENEQVQYTIDREHFYASYEEAKKESDSPSTVSLMGEWFSKRWRWMFSNKDNSADGKVIQRVVDGLSEDIQRTAKFSEKVINKQGTQVSAGLATGLAAKSYGGFATVGFGASAASIAIMAQDGPPSELKKDVERYIKKREGKTENSAEEARDHIEDVGAQPQTLNMFDDDTKIMYEAFEASYRRYCVIQKMYGMSCRNT